MRPKRFLWRLYLSYLVVVVVSVITMSWYATSVVRDLFLVETRRELATFAHALESDFGGTLSSPSTPELEAAIRNLGSRAQKRITLIDTSGVVIADSEQEPSSMENHATRPEVLEARSGNAAYSMRFSATLHTDMIYAAYPVKHGSEIAGFIRISVPVVSISNTLLLTDRRILFAALLICVGASTIAFFAYRRLLEPLERVKEGAVRFAKGDLTFRVYARESQEMSELSDAMNEMATQLDTKIRTILQQTHEQEAVLTSMVEGVLAIDRSEKVLRINRAAAAFLEETEARVQGRTVSEVVRSAELQRVVRAALISNTPLEEEVTLIGNSEKRIRVYTRPLLDGGQVSMGVLIVLHDVTKLRKLETMRREFVANVSHELRTPIMSVKGSAETLLEGALDDPDDARRFVDIIARHADRLNRLVEDLLSLARLEDEGAEESISFEEVALQDILTCAVEVCQVKAAQKGINISIQCPRELFVHANVMLLEQAVVNLLTNAIDYSESGSEVRVLASGSGENIGIQVQDSGAESHRSIFLDCLRDSTESTAREPGKAAAPGSVFLS